MDCKSATVSFQIVRRPSTFHGQYMFIYKMRYLIDIAMQDFNVMLPHMRVSLQCYIRQTVTFLLGLNGITGISWYKDFVVRIAIHFARTSKLCKFLLINKYDRFFKVMLLFLIKNRQKCDNNVKYL